MSRIRNRPIAKIAKKLRFRTFVELDQLREQESQRAEQERQQKEAALLQLQLEQQRYQDLLARLQERGIDPEQLQ